MKCTKKLLFLSTGIIVPLILVIIVLELIFGSWLGEDEWSKTRTINIIRDIQIKYNVENIYSKDLNTIIYTRDKNGLRGSCKDPKEIDVLTIGGSTTDQKYISDGKTYQDSLQILLSEKYRKQICVSNAGVDGHSTFGHLESFKIWFPLIKGLKPKYFLFYIGINDAGFRTAPNAGFDIVKRDGESTILFALRQKSAIYNSLRSFRNVLNGIFDKRAYAGHFKSKPSKTDYTAAIKTNFIEAQIAKNTESFEKRFVELILQARSYGAKPICVSQPHLLTKNVNGASKGAEAVFEYLGVTYNGLDFEHSISALNKSMMRLCLENDGYFIDVASKNFEDEDFYDLVHMNQLGAKRLGNYMYEEIVRQKIPF
jgi:hypothetical protein